MKKKKLYYLILPTVIIAFFILLYVADGRPRFVSPPKLLNAEINAQSHVSLSWEDCEDEEFFRVYRVEGNEADYRFLCDVTEPCYIDTTAQEGSIYKYKVTANKGNAQSEGVISNSVEIAKQDAEQGEILQSPTITSVTKLDRYTAVIMFDGIDEECTYRIMRSAEKNGPYTFMGETKDCIYYDTTLFKGESYYYTVTAVNEFASGNPSEPEKTGMNAKYVFDVPVMMYHQFLSEEDVESGVNFGEYAIWDMEFESDLIWLKRNGYTTITTKELMTYMTGEATPPAKPIILTIDDGYRGVYLNAWPLLQKYDMKAVFSVIGDRIDAASFEDVDAPHSERLYCNWDELQIMQNSGYVEIISHTSRLHNDEDMTSIRRGANCAQGESEESFFTAAITDYVAVTHNFKKTFNYVPYSMSYPYSSRSVTSDNVWMKCGYKILYAGNSSDARKSVTNYFVHGAGITRDSAVLRRVARMHGTTLYQYVRDYF